MINTIRFINITAPSSSQLFCINGLHQRVSEIYRSYRVTLTKQEGKGSQLKDVCV